MRKLVIITLIVFILSCVLSPLQASTFVPASKALCTIIIFKVGNSIVLINGKEQSLEIPPVIIAGRTLVPLRFIGEALGAEVFWEPADKKITLVSDGKIIVLWLDKNIAFIDNVRFDLDTPPILVDGRTLVPLRFVASSLGAEVIWMPEAKVIEIRQDAKGKVMGEILTGGVDLAKRELYLLKDKVFVRAIGLDSAIIEGKAERLEDIPLKIPAVFWGVIEEEAIKIRRLIVGVKNIPPVKEEIIEGTVLNIDLKDSSIRIVKRSKEEAHIRVHNRTEILLEGKRVTLSDIKRGFEVKIEAHLEPGRTLALLIKATRAPISISGIIKNIAPGEILLEVDGSLLKVKINTQTEIVFEGNKRSLSWLLLLKKSLLNRIADVYGYYDNKGFLATFLKIGPKR